MLKKNNTIWLSAILWAIFVIGILETMFFTLEDGDFTSYLILTILFGITIIITAIKTYQPRIGYYHEITPYLIHPVFLFVGITSFLVFNDSVYLKQILILLTLMGFTVLFSENYSDLSHKAHDGIKFLIIFLLFNTVFEAVHLFGYSVYMIPLFIFLISIFLFIHMLWRLKAVRDINLFYSFIFSFFIGLASYLLSNYYIYASFLILSIILLTIYYVFWGILHHYIEKNLNWHVFIEYLLIAGIVISMFMGLITGW